MDKKTASDSRGGSKVPVEDPAEGRREEVSVTFPPNEFGAGFNEGDGG